MTAQLPMTAKLKQEQAHKQQLQQRHSKGTYQTGLLTNRQGVFQLGLLAGRKGNPQLGLLHRSTHSSLINIRQLLQLSPAPVKLPCSNSLKTRGLRDQYWTSPKAYRCC